MHAIQFNLTRGMFGKFSSVNFKVYIQQTCNACIYFLTNSDRTNTLRCACKMHSLILVQKPKNFMYVQASILQMKFWWIFSRKSIFNIPVRMTSPSTSVMIELIWLIKYGILKIISLVEPFCRVSPSTWLIRFKIIMKFCKYGYKWMSMCIQSQVVIPLTITPNHQGLEPLSRVSAKSMFKV